jgi:hypothetical protein
VKKLVLPLALCFLLTPALAFAGHYGISATEMVTSGIAAAASIGVAGYVILRRRRAGSHQS